MADRSAAAGARIELAKIAAAESLRKKLARARAAKALGEEDGSYFQSSLYWAYADFVRHIFCAELAEYLKQPWSGAELLGALNHTAQELVARAIPMWRDSGGEPQYKDQLVEVSFKTIKASRCYRYALEEIAKRPDENPGTNDGQDERPSADSVELSSSQPAISHQADPQPASDDARPIPEKRASRAKRKPVKRHFRYKNIDDALRKIGDGRPRNHREVFKELDAAKVPVPLAEPFHSRRGWEVGFLQNGHRASAWLSKTWSRLDLPTFARGPKKSAEVQGQNPPSKCCDPGQK